MRKEDEFALVILAWLFLFLTGYCIVRAMKDNDALGLVYAGIAGFIFWLIYRKI